MSDTEVRADGGTLITDAMVERAARAIERDRCPGYTDADFEIWWTRDPLFVSQPHGWGHFRGTGKEKLLREVRIALEAAFTGEPDAQTEG